MTPARRTLVGALVLVVTAIPGIRLVVQGGDAPDGFPLSTYPMFTRDRGRIVEVPSVVIADGDVVRRLSPQVIAATDQVIEAGVVVQQAIAAGGRALADFCEDVAERAGADTDDDADADTAVEVVIERYDSHRWAAGDDEPAERRVVASC